MYNQLDRLQDTQMSAMESKRPETDDEIMGKAFALCPACVFRDILH